jgi:hypothetical protein
MPPFRSQRIDPYYHDDRTGSGTTNNSLQHGTARQRTLVDHGQRPVPVFGDGGHRTSSFPPPSGGGGGDHGGFMVNNGTAARQPQHIDINSSNTRATGNNPLYPRHASVEAREFPQSHYAAEIMGHTGTISSSRHEHEQQQKQQQYDYHESIIKSKTGAAPLASHLHPLMELRRRNRAQIIINPGEYNDYDGDSEYYKGNKPRGRRDPTASASLNNGVPTTKEVISHMLFILARILGFIPERKKGKYHTTSIDHPTARLLRLLLLISLLTYTTKRIFSPILDRMTHPKPWSWSGGISTIPNKIVPHRNLAGRNCVMNYFIEKQPPDEYDPDFVDIKPGELNKDGTPKIAPPIKIVDGSYRTKGQVQTISRFIEAVADSFRANTKIRQHLIFAEVRDSGHLAYEAMRHWPPRGSHRVTVHVLASSGGGSLPLSGGGSDGIILGGTNNAADKALGYGTLEDIELRFKGNSNARIYDHEGKIAGLLDTDGVDDDEVLNAMVEMDAPDQETLDLRLNSGRRRRRLAQTNNNSSSTFVSEGMTPYPNLRTLLPFEDEDDGEGEIVVPYLHVDGMSMANQMRVLESARSLFEDKRAVAVGIEHSPDMDVRVLIEFFTSVRYKTFYLGTRQIARIDNLCEEVLDDVLEHPYVKKHDHKIRHFFIRLGFLSTDELRMSGDASTPEGPRRRETPPFFVAMPRGRKNKEEMTIQTMYDLFSGSGGGGQVKTANDRKAPGKK